MSNVNNFTKALQKQITKMSKTGLYKVESDKDTIWNLYLDSFEPGENEIFVERREHDCNCCKQFIRDIGRVVTIVNGELVSVFDVKTDKHYQPVADALAAYVKSLPVQDAYIHYQAKVGSPTSHQQLSDGSVKTWDHLAVVLPMTDVDRKDRIPTRLNDVRSNRGVFKRSLQEISVGSAEVVLELIEQGTLYRGEEHKRTVKAFIQSHKDHQKITPEHRENWYWTESATLGPASKFRNTVIGTLMADIAEGTDLDVAVTKYEVKVAPMNYKRPKALVTQGMIKKAQKTVESLGIQDSLQRRYAVVGDITINNVLFADRSAKASMGIFDEMLQETQVNKRSLEKVEEVSIDDFLNNILPKAEGIQILMENTHRSNLMSLIAPVNPDAPNILKWDNNFSWSYVGDLTDSIKERVKAQGGKVDGHLRVSLSWHNRDDLDIHVVEPCGNKIYYGNSQNRSTGGTLDVDMNASGRLSCSAVENVTWPTACRMKEGTYEVRVNQYQLRESANVGYEVEMECMGEVLSFAAPTSPSNTDTVVVFRYSHKDGIKVISGISSTQTPVEEWGAKTQVFTKVNLIMNSPNHWDGEATGNKHVFFILEGAKQEGKARGFYNEFLGNHLQTDRKVFEVLGSKMKTPESDDQLTGLGFSSTQRNSMYAKVTGAFERTIKINF